MIVIAIARMKIIFKQYSLCMEDIVWSKWGELCYQAQRHYRYSTAIAALVYQSYCLNIKCLPNIFMLKELKELSGPTSLFLFNSYCGPIFLVLSIWLLRNLTSKKNENIKIVVLKMCQLCQY